MEYTPGQSTDSIAKHLRDTALKSYDRELESITLSRPAYQALNDACHILKDEGHEFYWFGGSDTFWLSVKIPATKSIKDFASVLEKMSLLSHECARTTDSAYEHSACRSFIYEWDITPYRKASLHLALDIQSEHPVCHSVLVGTETRVVAKYELRCDDSIVAAPVPVSTAPAHDEIPF